MTAISYDGFAVRESLQRLAERTADLRPALREIGETLVLSAQQRFEAERGPDGQPWRPLAPATILRRLARGGRAAQNRRDQPAGGSIVKILQDSGHLRQSIHWALGADYVDVGSDRLYARIHQLGGLAGRGHQTAIPARPFLGVDPDDDAQILDLLSFYLEPEPGHV